MDKPIIDQIKEHILDIQSETGLNKPWCEGYFSAHVNLGHINEDEFDELIDWINSIYSYD